MPSLPAVGNSAWPPLALDEWADTLATLHRWVQMVGKTRLALEPMVNHWWQVVLFPTARGLGTPPMPSDGRFLELEFDFIDHALIGRTSTGEVRRIPLEPKPVAQFYQEYRAMLEDLGVHPRIWPVPTEMGDRLPFPDDRIHAAYDPDAAQRCWRAIESSARVLQEFRGGFLGKSSPVHFWWGGFDLACTRFSGRPAPVHPGGIPNIPDYVTREAYSHECISAGWWPGMPDGPVTETAFYAYAYPEPPGCPEASIRPAAAYYFTPLREWILPYDAVRTAADPDAMLLEFLESTYQVASELGQWDNATLLRPGGRTGR
jgi:hypothetical protein